MHGLICVSSLALLLLGSCKQIESSVKNIFGSTKEQANLELDKLTSNAIDEALGNPTTKGTPTPASSRRDLGEVAAAAGKDALGNAHKDSAADLMAQGVAASKKEEWQQAAGFFATSAAVRPTPEAFTQLGRVLQTMGEKSGGPQQATFNLKARQSYVAALKLDANYAPAKIQLQSLSPEK